MFEERPQSPYRCSLVVRLHHVDAAGVIFYARLYELAQEAMERFFLWADLPLAQLFESPCLTPVVHSEADYFSPIRIGKRLDVEVSIERIGRSSFTIACRFFDEQKHLSACSRTVNVVIDKKTGNKRDIPEDWRWRLEKFYQPPQKESS